MAQVVVWAENSVTRAGLAAMVTATTLEVTEQFSTLAQLQAELRTQSTDLVLMAPSVLSETITHHLVQIVTEDPLETSRAILLLVDFWPDASPLETAENSDHRQLQRHLTSLFATGGVSMLPLSVSTAQVQGAIAAILQGFVVIHPDLVNLVSANPPPLVVETEVDRDGPLDPLTQREIEVLNQLAAGLSNKAIAQQLTISEHTVKFHISAILAKLNVASRTEAVAVGIRTGLVML